MVPLRRALITVTVDLRVIPAASAPVIPFITSAGGLAEPGMGTSQIALTFRSSTRIVNA